jgi:hypothetical protein
MKHNGNKEAKRKIMAKKMRFTVNADIHHEADLDGSFILLTKLPAVINTRHIIFLHIKSMVDTVPLNFLQITHYLSKEEFVI